ncbi:1-deoxy-D-xylulose-5-phosphate reductoisomerase [Sulfuriflexus sp.]|uniref:1-deoxy-D-xylulose-5-phosphate reductoisomerase n=1 Tax=Sulfuriflexus sp. TaxID=2015443 RepID=UPI0028CC4E76|nr:1-deoxy-D-xylulose-5-phosphate reductoisomerase [Sulfuriflexus sp.]MDT8402980.1 1-deoxy-D-xylulose-5-phosphate reductoisomerase [Sulfuriflexus sp.]
MKGITILGATGSIGISTLDVVRAHAGDYQVVALTANRDVERLLAQCREFAPAYAVMADPSAAARLAGQVQAEGLAVEVLAGSEGLERVAALPQTDYVMAAIVGAAGLLPTLAAARAGKRILLANKEALVMSGHLFMQAVREHGAELLPIDSEHNAIFQCMPQGYRAGMDAQGVRRILLTGSGGPFRDIPVEQLAGVTPEQAIAHPNWSMGRKISVDSATMMNKGLELIEACWLFDVGPDTIEIVVHKESVIHSMVDYLDGSVLAQLGNPDMRTPIAHALAWPRRIDSGVAALDIVTIGQLNFERPDLQRFPCLRLADEAIRAGGTASTILNAANEVAVEAFLQGQLAFTAIAGVIETCMQSISFVEAESLDTILNADTHAREVAMACINSPERHTAS